MSFGHERTHSTLMNASTAHQGPKWFGGNSDFFLTDSGTAIIVRISAGTSLTFTLSGSTYSAPNGLPWSLTHDTTKKIFLLTMNDRGQQIEFNNFDATIPVAERGRVIHRTDRDWTNPKTGWTFAYAAASDRLISGTAPTGQPYTAAYTYSGNNLTTMIVKDTSTNTEVQKTEFTYKDGTHHADCGNTGALILVKVSTRTTDGQWQSRYTHYRYAGDKMKYEFDASSIKEIQVDEATITTPEVLLTRSDTQLTTSGMTIASYSSKAFDYVPANVTTNSVTTIWAAGENLESKYGGSGLTETGFTSQEVVRGPGGGGGCCGGGGSGGQLILYYYYMTNAGHTAGNINSVERLMVEDAIDSSGQPIYRQIYGTSENGALLRKVFIDHPITSPKYWCESWKIDAGNNLISEHRLPSAHNVTSDAQLATFFDGHVTANDDATLRTSDGVIELFTYSGDRLTDEKVKKGKNGTAYYVAATDFVGGTNNNRKYLVTGQYTYPTQTTTRTAGLKTTIDYAFWGTSDEVLTKRTTFPIVSGGENGSGVASERWEYFDTEGRLRWVKDGEGYVTYLAYHPRFGTQAYQVADADPGTLPAAASDAANATKWILPTEGSANSNKPTRDALLPAAIAAETTSEYDVAGRSILNTAPGGAQHRTVYLTNRTVKYLYWNATAATLPIQVTDYREDGQVSQTFTLPGNKAASTGGVPTGLASFTQADYQSWTQYFYDAPSARATQVWNYHNIPSSGNGTLSTNYYLTAYGYDAQGRQTVTVQTVSGTSTASAVEQVTRKVFDKQDRVVEVQRGVSGNGQNMGADYSTLPTMGTVSRTVYDDAGVGDSLVTLSVQYHGLGASDNVGVAYKRTFRGHLRGTEPVYGYNASTNTVTGTASPFQVNDIDWLGRTLGSATYDAAVTWSSVFSANDGYATYAETMATNRKAFAKAFFDGRGQAYRQEKYLVNQSTGALLSKLVTDSYFDGNGAQVATQLTNGLGSETAYDGLGRSYQTRSVKTLSATKYTSGKFNYLAPAPSPLYSSANTGAMTGGNGGVVTLQHSVFNSAGNVTESHSFETLHTDTDGLSLGTTDHVRQSVYTWYDLASRPTDMANYGSGGATWSNFSVPTRPTSAPTASSSSLLLTKTSYHSLSGDPEITTDPLGTKTKVILDDLGRKLYVVSNFVNFAEATETNTGGTDKSQDQVVKYVYDGLGNVTQLIAMDQNADGNTSDNQVTKYLYENAYNASLATNTIYPDSTDTTSSGTDQVKVAYDLQGKPTSRTDQRGTKLDYTYVTATQLLEWEKATTLAGADPSIQSIQRVYDSLRRPATVRSNSTTSGGTIQNEIVTNYDELLAEKEVYQSQQGAVSGSTPYVQYSRDTTATGGVYDNLARVNQVRYPSGRLLRMEFGTAGSVEDLASRISRLKGNLRDNGSDANYVTYGYTGSGRVVRTYYETPQIEGSYDVDGTAGYEFLDGYGRVVTRDWRRLGSLRDQVSYVYDYAGNRLSRDIPTALYATNDQDQLYSYDSGNRLINAKRGTLASGAIAAPPFQQEWFLDGLGNWSTFQEDTGNNGWDISQLRGHNAANELSTINLSSTNLSHDAAGNMTKVPQPANWGANYDLVYDAWNRLVAVKQGATTVASFEYDGLGRRINKVAGGVTEEYYYNSSYQILEVRRGGVMREQLVWNVDYIDSLALRLNDFHNGVGGGADGDFLDTNETHYAIQDAAYNVTALADTGGTVFERYLYSAYGAATVLDAGFTLDADGVSDVANPYAYTGRQMDVESGLNFFRTRYYQSQLGRFVSRDSIGYAGGINLYRAYFAVSGTDPLGYEFKKDDDLPKIEDYWNIGPWKSLYYPDKRDFFNISQRGIAADCRDACRRLNCSNSNPEKTGAVTELATLTPIGGPYWGKPKVTHNKESYWWNRVEHWTTTITVTKYQDYRITQEVFVEWDCNCSCCSSWIEAAWAFYSLWEMDPGKSGFPPNTVLPWEIERWTATIPGKTNINLDLWESGKEGLWDLIEEQAEDSVWGGLKE